MWIMTSYGILMPAARPAQTIEFGDPNTMQVRARDRDALTDLRKRMISRGYTPSGIIATPEKDYDFRMYTTPASFAHMMSLEIEAIDYEKFKPTAKTRFLHDLYVRIWSVVYSEYEPAAMRRRRKAGNR